MRRLDRHSLFASREITGGLRGQKTLTFSLHKDNATSQTDTTLFYVLRHSWLQLGKLLPCIAHSVLFAHVYVWHR